MTEKKEIFLSKYNFDNRFHIHIYNYSVIMLDPIKYGYQYEIYDLVEDIVIGRYDSILDVCKTIEIKNNKKR